MPYAVYAEILPDTTIGRVSMTMLVPPAPWVAVPRAWWSALRSSPAAPSRYRYVDGVFVEKTRLRLSVSTPSFRADGEDHADVLLSDDADPARTDDVAIEINDEPTVLRVGEVLELSSVDEGTFLVRLTDPRFYADPAVRQTTALATEVGDE